MDLLVVGAPLSDSLNSKHCGAVYLQEGALEALRSAVKEALRAQLIEDDVLSDLLIRRALAVTLGNACCSFLVVNIIEMPLF